MLYTVRGWSSNREKKGEFLVDLIELSCEPIPVLNHELHQLFNIPSCCCWCFFLHLNYPFDISIERRYLISLIDLLLEFFVLLFW